MKITVIPTGTPVTHYAFSGETITAFCKGEQEDFDLSSLRSNAEFQSISVDTLDTSPSQIIRAAYRDDAGELHVTLCQGVGSGNWEDSDELGSESYNPDAVYVKLNQEKAFSGTPKVTTRQGAV